MLQVALAASHCGMQELRQGTGSKAADRAGSRKLSRSGGEHRARSKTAEWKIGEGKEIRVALGKGRGLICGTPTKRGGPCCPEA